MKKILMVLTLMLGLTTMGFSDYFTDRYEYYGDRTTYEKVYSRYSAKFDLLYTRLDQKNDALRKEKNKKNWDKNKIEKLQYEKRIITRELDATYKDLRYDLKTNNIRYR